MARSIELPKVEIIEQRRRATEWRERKTQLRRWCAAAHADGDKAAVAILQEMITDHNRQMPRFRLEKAVAHDSYKARLAAFLAAPRPDPAQEARFDMIDRLMRQRYGVNVSDPR